MAVLQIENLKCGGCANTIKKGLLSINGIDSVVVHVDSSEVEINSEDHDVINNATIKLSSMGYPLIGNANSILKKAKSYVSCAVGRITNED